MSATNRIYFNGKIFTSNKNQPYAEAMIVENGRVAWIGEEKDMPAKAYEKVDLKGKRVLPGFVDSHMHAIMLAANNKQISSLPPLVNSIEELTEAIRKVRDKQGPEAWVQGWGYDEGKLAERRAPNRYDLDKGAADVPVSIVRTCGHVRCVNSKALELAGIDRNTPDPQGGVIDRDENGEPTGVLRENARNLVTPLMPVTTTADSVDDLVDLNRTLLAQGVTTISDLGELDDSDYYEVFVKAREKGFRPRVAMYYMWDNFKDKEGFKLDPARMDPKNEVRVAGIKLIGDGSVSGRTAWSDRPYLGSDDEYGLPVCTEEDIQDAIAFCKKYNVQLSIHAMGARAIDRAVDAAYAEGSWLSDDKIPFVRVEHVAMPTKQAIKKAAEAGIGFVTQPIFLYAEIESYLTNLGVDWMKETYPINDMLAAGVKLSFSTDAPATAWATPSDPFPCLKGAVTRVAYDGTDCGEAHRVDIETAIRLYTAEGQQMLGLEGVGQLAEGYHADFIVLDRDILAIPSEEIDQVKVEATFMDGEMVYEK